MVTGKRLIDANVVLAKKFTAGLSDASGNYYGHADVVFADDIENVPTVDAVEVVHGRTIQAEEPQHIWMDRECEKCHCLMLITDNYCPECGAKTDGDEDA